MQSLQKRCGELNLHPCREAGMTKAILLHKINDEERRRGLSLTVLPTTTTVTRAVSSSSVGSKPVAAKRGSEKSGVTKTEAKISSKGGNVKRGSQNVSASQKEPNKTEDDKRTPSSSKVAEVVPPSSQGNQYAEEIREMNPELYNSVKPFFDSGVVPTGHHWGIETTDAANRWNSSNNPNAIGLIRDPWHSLHAQLTLLGLEGEEREKDRARIERYTGEKPKYKDWAFKTRENVISFVNHYDLILWGIWLANKRRTSLLTLFTKAGRLDLYLPVKKVTTQMLEGIYDLETARTLYDIDPMIDMSKIGPANKGYWQIASGQMTKEIALKYAESVWYSAEKRKLITLLLDLGYLQPSPTVLLRSLTDETLFNRILNMPSAAFNKNEGEKLALMLRNQYAFYMKPIDGITAEDLEERIRQILDAFSIDVAQITTDTLIELSHSNLLPAFLGSPSVQNRLREIVMAEDNSPGLYTIKRIFEQSYDRLIDADDWKKLIILGLRSWRFNPGTAIIGKRYPIPYGNLLDAFQNTEDLSHHTAGEMKIYLSSIVPQASYDNNMIIFFVESLHDMQLLSNKKYAYYIDVAIRLDIYQLDKQAIAELVDVLPTPSAKLLLSRPKVKKLLDKATLDRLSKSLERRKA